LYIEEVVEACNRLKGGKLAKEKVKLQLQKIANSRTGGSKTDEALGKAGGGPEGLPHSIIVTEEGVEGDVAAASQVDAVRETSAQIDGDLLGEPAPPASKPDKRGRKTTQKQQAAPAGSRRKSDQMALFDKAADVKPGGKRGAALSMRKARGKK
jgi:DNA topoisomerase-6 subunit B